AGAAALAGAARRLNILPGFSVDLPSPHVESRLCPRRHGAAGVLVVVEHLVPRRPELDLDKARAAVARLAYDGRGHEHVEELNLEDGVRGVRGHDVRGGAR